MDRRERPAALTSRVAAAKYGAHTYDQWSVDELLELASRAAQPSPTTS